MQRSQGPRAAPVAGHRIEPSVGGLVGVLKKAMNDSNRNVAAAVIRLCASLCLSIGGRFSSTGRQLVAPIVKAASDMKPAVQAAVAEFASTYIMQVRSPTRLSHTDLLPCLPRCSRVAALLAVRLAEVHPGFSQVVCAVTVHGAVQHVLPT